MVGAAQGDHHGDAVLCANGVGWWLVGVMVWLEKVMPGDRLCTDKGGGGWVGGWVGGCGGWYIWVGWVVVVVG